MCKASFVRPMPWQHARSLPGISRLQLRRGKPKQVVLYALLQQCSWPKRCYNAQEDMGAPELQDLEKSEEQGQLRDLPLGCEK